ncbi:MULTISPECIES: hypothetical protein [unclassified Acidovorax]|nr:hypothetical protein [Acidovorax sp. sif0715]
MNPRSDATAKENIRNSRSRERIGTLVIRLHDLARQDTDAEVS